MNFEKLVQNIRDAEKEMETALSRQWPLGSRVGVHLNSRQQFPTGGTVLGHNGQGYVTVQIDSAFEHSRRKVRHVYFTYIFG